MNSTQALYIDDTFIEFRDSLLDRSLACPHPDRPWDWRRRSYCPSTLTMKLDGNRRCWLAAYTRSRYEHEVARQFGQQNLEHLLPTYERLSRWSDRIKRTRTPLFPGYVFVRICESERLPVLQTLGVVHLVTVAGEPAILSDEEVDRLRVCVQAGEIEPHPYLKIGRRVRVKHGPFIGWEGTLVDQQNACRLVVTIEQIQQSIAINLHRADVEPI